MRNYIPKNLKDLRDEQLEECPQNNILFDKLQQHIKIAELIKLELLKDISTKEMISLSNTLNGNSKIIIAIMNSFLYIEDEETDEIDTIIKDL